MKLYNFAVNKLSGVTKATRRFFMSFACLLAVAVLNIIQIETAHSFEKQIISLVFGVFCFLCAQVLCERFGKSLLTKGLFYIAAAGAAVLHYFYVLSEGGASNAVVLKTTVLIFISVIAFIWIPSVKKPTDFPGVFLNVFKSFFTSAFFSGIIYGGVTAIIAAIDALIVRVDSDAHLHSANIIWVLWAPMLLLSLIPVFAKDPGEEKLDSALRYPKFLEMLLSYVLIPLASIYTFVLVIYMGKTIILASWSDNMLEPMVLLYLIAVLVLYILVRRLDNAFTRFFKVSVPLIFSAIAVFQITSSVIKAVNEGIIVSRYFILIFSLYSVICGILLFVKRKKKADFIAWLAIIFAAVSISPLMGAFDVSSASQSGIAISTLEKNNMLANGKLVKNPDISQEDMEKIRNSVRELHESGRLDRLEFLPSDFQYYTNFKRVFGFDIYDTTKPNAVSKYFRIDTSQPLSLSGYEYMLGTSFGSYLNDGLNLTLCTLTRDAGDYTVKLVKKNLSISVVFRAPNDAELLTVSFDEIFNILAGYETAEDDYYDADKLTFDYENESAKARIVFNRASIYDTDREADIYVLFTIK